MRVQTAERARRRASLLSKVRAVVAWSAVLSYPQAHCVGTTATRWMLLNGCWMAVQFKLLKPE